MTPIVVPAGGATTKRVTSCGGVRTLARVLRSPRRLRQRCGERNRPRQHSRRRLCADSRGRRVRLRAAAGDPLELQLDVARRLPPVVRMLRQTALDDVIERGRQPLFACVDEIAGGCAVRIEAIRLAWLSPSNALRPVAISKTSAPNAKRSVRASASLPSSCSGAMY